MNETNLRAMMYVDIYFLCLNISDSTIIIGYYTVDCTIPIYIWTSAQMTTILDEPIGHESKYISVLYSQLYNYLFIIYQLRNKTNS